MFHLISSEYILVYGGSLEVIDPNLRLNASEWRLWHGSPSDPALSQKVGLAQHFWVCKMPGRVAECVLAMSLLALFRHLPQARVRPQPTGHRRFP